MRCFKLSFRFVVCMLSLMLLFTNAHAFETGLAPATRKIMPETEMPTEQSITIKAARNEWEGFQIVIRNSAALTEINVEVSDLTDGNGNKIEKSNASLYKEHFLYVDDASNGNMTNHERGIGFYPDPLIPFFDKYKDGNPPLGAPFDITSEETGVVFVDWHVPMDQTPGLYSGKATVTAKDSDAIELEINLQVWEYTIPKQRTISTAFGFGFDKQRDYHCGEVTDTTCEEEMNRRYLNAMHEHRMDTTHLQGPVSFEFDDDDNLKEVDWTAYDAFIEPFITGSMFDDGIGITRFNVKHFKPGSGQGNMTEDQYAQAAAAFAEHLEAKGWWDHAYVYSTDEPWMNGGQETFDQIAHDVALLNKYTDLWEGHVLITGPYVPDLHDEVGIWCPVTPMFDDWFWLNGVYAGREEYAELLKEGKELWFYVCNANVPPYAGYDIDAHLGYEPRIVKWGSWFEGATGFLYWRVNYWPLEDPWNVLLNLESFGDLFARNGDGVLLYPGDHNGEEVGKGSPENLVYDGPIVSYRMKQIRDGIEDWELFIQAENLGAKDYAKEQVGRAYKQFGTFTLESCTTEGAYCPGDEPWTLDENLLQEVRENIANKVLFLLYPDKYVDPEAQPVDGDSDEEIEDGDMDSTDNDLFEEDLTDTTEETTEDGDITEEDQNQTNNQDGGSSCSQSNGYNFLFALLLLVGLIAIRRKTARAE